jgi:hypothetical protein
MSSALVTLALACAPPDSADTPARSTLIVGLDVSGSFRSSQHFADAIDLASFYIYGHLHGVGGLRRSTSIFVGSLGGERPDEPKTFHPIQDLTGKSAGQIAADLRAWFAETDNVTDYSAFFQRAAVHVKRQNLVLAPLEIVVFSDGVPDISHGRHVAHPHDPAWAPPESLYSNVDLGPLEYLSRSVTVRLLYATPPVAQGWERWVKRSRVRLWTQDAEVMRGWRRHFVAGAPPERQDSLWSWVTSIVDMRVRRGPAVN